jgi:hypothetical protein
MNERYYPLFLLVALAVPARAAEGDFVPLIKGNDLGQFELVGLDADSMSLRDGEVRLDGKRKGYFATKTSYKNYVLDFEWRFERPAKFKDGDKFDGNSGVLLHIQGKPQVWPKGIEIQVWHKHQYGDFYTHGGAKFNPKKDEHAALEKLLKPVGEWNRHTTTCRDSTITLAVNGKEIAHGIKADPDQGQIGWMNEDLPVRFRNLRIKKLD